MTDKAAVGLAVVVAAVAWASPPVPSAAALLFVALWAVTRRPVLLLVALVVFVGGRANESLAALAAPLPEEVDGVAQLVSDPEADRFGTRVVVRVDGRRYLAQVPSDRAAGLRTMLTGERVHLTGRPRPFSNAPEGWLRSQHLAGRLAVTSVSDPEPGPIWYRLANGVHRVLAAGADPFGERRSLYLGLVVGDDRGQPDLTRFRFEAAGLTHLLAVSGSNVAFVLAVFAPILQRVGSNGRILLGGSVLVLFALVTRAEPSVLRAAVMAGIALVAVTVGRVAPGTRILAVTVSLLLAVDPLLVHSIGFQLSVAATAGLMVLSVPIMERLPGPGWLTAPIAVTLAAQLATAPLLIALSGGLPAVATLANLLAGPAAGAVMVLGVTVGFLSGLVGDSAAAVLQVPAVLLVRWIDEVARVSSQLPSAFLGPGRLALLAIAVGTGLAVRRWSAGPPAGVAVVGVFVVGSAALALAGVALWPQAPAPGVHRLPTGAELVVGACGGRVLWIDGQQHHRKLLWSLWSVGVRRLDVLVVGESRSAASAALVVAEQLPVDRTVTTSRRAPPGMEPLGSGELHVGGVVVAGPDGSDATGRAGAEVAFGSREPEGDCHGRP